ncbi:TIGR03016 family PEP-CTERM system-associated outer membrane protein [Permianibacter sp. IMCC34836]|uniref:TIGR03016 family PEP-CTERM system-associated outer membrane protein n=1 Tax=Permianibacter fluminis TaxID=2738515 RepID=UPI001557D485|nr:TIGR03016 family PEP-CTERM system-associated outer membrane protein [Permianibacter fluminis]NQD35584.1 TIGR03016 family PEP-CTERM system-associated outer membrane protein [Permianibacter fluminis]
MRGARPFALSLLPLFLLVPAAQAGHWDFTPTISLREIYSDNIGLSETDPQSDWVTELTPGFTLRGQSDAFRMNLNASSQNLYYHDAAIADGDHTQSNPQLTLSSTTTLLPSLFYVDIGGSAGQRLVSDSNRGSYDNIALSGDRTDYSTYTIAPYLRHRARNGIFFEARAERGVSEFDRDDPNRNDVLHDATTENYRVRLDNQAMNTGLHWSVVGTRRYIDRKSETLADPDFRSAQIDLSYQLSTTLAVLGRAGRSESELGGFDSDRNGDYSAGGFQWSPNRRFNLSALAGSGYSDAEMNWKPSRRTDFSLGYRDTDIGLVAGPSWRASAKFRGRSLTSSLSYNEEVTTEQQLVLDHTEFVPFIDQNGNPVIDPVTHQVLGQNVNFFAIADDEFERHRGALSTVWKARRATINLTLSKEDRQYLVRDELDNESYGGAINFSWPLAAGTSLLSQYREQHGEFTSDGAKEDFQLASLGLRIDLSKRSYTSLSVQKVQQDSDRGGRSYDEGRVIAELNMQF